MTIHAARILNCNPSKQLEKNWSLQHAAAAGIFRPAKKLPAAVDLRAAWWTIGDQADTGACVGWALADSVLRWHFTKKALLKKTEGLSPRFIWMAAKETDDDTSVPTTFIEPEGTSLKAALDIARTFGSVKEALLPFNSNRLCRKEAPAFYAAAAQYKIKCYFEVDRNPNALKKWLAGHGPVFARIFVDVTWMNAAKTKGILDKYVPSTAYGGHAIAIVGYTADTFIIRNSWGTRWGDKGHAYASFGYLSDALTEAYGITV